MPTPESKGWALSLQVTRVGGPGCRSRFQNLFEKRTIYFGIFEGLTFRRSHQGWLGTAADSKILPDLEPRTVGKLFIVPPIRGRDVAFRERSAVRHLKDAPQPLDLGMCLLIHWHSSITKRL